MCRYETVGDVAGCGGGVIVIDMRFYMPAPDLRPLLSSYYVLDFDVAEFTDIVQAEQANIRFSLGGDYIIHVGKPGTQAGEAMGGALLFGHRSKPMTMQAFGPGKVFGVGVLPLGFRALFGMPADEIANRVVPLADVMGPAAWRAEDVMRAHGNDAMLVETANALFRNMAFRDMSGAANFQGLVSDWLTGSESPEVDDLVAACDVCARQVERLCHQYLGVPPKLLARKSRTLRAVSRLRLNPGMDWMDAAGPGFYDQSHFIREFRSFTGLTPSAFARLKTPMMEQSVRYRTAHRLIPKLSLLS